jgi:tetratricopeptide (TPR) repeat protein
VTRTSRVALVLGVCVTAGVIAWTASRRSGEVQADVGTSRVAAARTFWATYQEASAHRSAGDCERAILLYREALRQRPGHEDSLYYLGNCLRERGDYGDAIEAYRQLADLNAAGSSRAWMQWALVHASLEPSAPFDIDRAGALLHRAMATDPDSGARLGLAEIALLRGDDARARLLLEQLTAESPLQVSAPYLLGYIASRTGDPAAGWQHFVVAVQRAAPAPGHVQWSEEGDVKAAPAMRWRALARQSMFGEAWLPPLMTLASTGESPTPQDMHLTYAHLDDVIARARSRGSARSPGT